MPSLFPTLLPTLESTGYTSCNYLCSACPNIARSLPFQLRRSCMCSSCLVLSFYSITSFSSDYPLTQSIPLSERSSAVILQLPFLIASRWSTHLVSCIKQPGMRGRQLSFHRPPCSSRTSDILLDCFRLKGPPRLTIEVTRFIYSHVIFFFRCLPCYPTADDFFNNGAVEPSDVGQSPFYCKFSMLQGQCGDM